MLLFVVCMTMTACGEDVEAYKQKMLAKTFEGEAGALGELLLSNLEMEIDSMSVLDLTVQDSLNLLEIQLEERKELTKKYEEQKKWIKDIEKDVKYANFSARMKFFDIKKENEERGKKIESMTKEYEAKQALYKDADKSKILNKVFIYRVKVISPISKKEEISSELALFSSDGEICIDNSVNALFEYYKNK